jgi:hypothetical protein
MSWQTVRHRRQHSASMRRIIGGASCCCGCHCCYHCMPSVAMVLTTADSETRTQCRENLLGKYEHKRWWRWRWLVVSCNIDWSAFLQRLSEGRMQNGERIWRQPLTSSATPSPGFPRACETLSACCNVPLTTAVAYRNPLRSCLWKLLISYRGDSGR